jgi:hypothetical protein
LALLLRERVLARRQGRGRDYWLIEAQAPDTALVLDIKRAADGPGGGGAPGVGVPDLAELLAGRMIPPDE